MIWQCRRLRKFKLQYFKGEGNFCLLINAKYVPITREEYLGIASRINTGLREWEYQGYTYYKHAHLVALYFVKEKLWLYFNDNGIDHEKSKILNEGEKLCRQ